MRGWRERRIHRLLDRARRERWSELIADNPPLPTRYEADAARLVELAPSALGDNEEEVRAIGERLNQRGGRSMMAAVLHRAEALSVQRGSYNEQFDYSIIRRIEVAWDGIGEWQA